MLASHLSDAGPPACPLSPPTQRGGSCGKVTFSVIRGPVHQSPTVVLDQSQPYQPGIMSVACVIQACAMRCISPYLSFLALHPRRKVSERSAVHTHWPTDKLIKAASFRIGLAVNRGFFVYGVIYMILARSGLHNQIVRGRTACINYDMDATCCN